MNHVATGAAATAALLIVGLPPVLGLLTEAQVRARVAALAGSGALTAEVRAFERGWFGGRAKIDLGIARDYLQSGAANGAPQLEALIGETAPLEVAFAYGPIAFSDGIHFGLSRMVARLDPESPRVANLERSLGIPYVFEFRGLTGFFGKLTFDADMPPVDLPMDRARVEFSGAQLAGTFARNRLAADGSMDRFQFSSPTGVFAVERVVAKVDNEIRSRYVMPGNAALSVQSVTVIDSTRGPAPVFEAAGASFDSVVQLDETRNLLRVQANGTLDSASVDGARIADASVGIAVSNLDAGALETYATTLRGVARADRAGLGTLRPALQRLLAAAPSVALDPVHFTFDGEPLTGRLEIVTNAGELPATGTLDLEDPETLLTLFDSSADIELSKKLAQSLAALAMQMQMSGDSTLTNEDSRRLAEAQSGLVIVALIGQGLLTENGDSYRTELRVADGAVTVNGARLPFSVP